MNSRAERSIEPAGGTSAWWVALSGGGMTLAGWFAPGVCAPVAGILCAVIILGRWRRGTVDAAGLAIVAGVTGFFCIKDVLTAGPLGRAAGELGVAAEGAARQPDTAAACSAAAVAGLCVFVFQLLRKTWSGEVGMRAWGRAVSGISAALAVVVLTAPHLARDYGDEFSVGEVASRNAAAGAFALAAMVAAGLVLDALRAGRSREWPVAAVAAGVCMAAAANLGSRGGLVALMAGAIYLVARATDGRVRRWGLAAGVLVIGAILVAPVTVARLGDLGEEYRVELWLGSMRVWREAPLGGVGGGGFADAFALFSGLVPVEGARVTHPDSSWVLLLTEWGVAGVAVVTVAGWLALRRGSARGAATGLRLGAEAGLVIWAVAAVGDISFHRAVTLVIALPLLAIVGAADGEGRKARAAGWTNLIGVALALVLAGLAMWERAGPLDMQVNHQRGFAALSDTDVERAAEFFEAAVAVDPANTAALQLYARALMSTAPERALPFWRRLFVAAGSRASGFLTEELTRNPMVPLRYWRKAVETRTDLWVVLADRDEAGAQGYFERWRTAPDEARARSPQWAVLGALARWGSVADMTTWLTIRPGKVNHDAAHGARFLRERGRGDIAWEWLAHGFPEGPMTSAREPDVGLRARVMANPDDYVAAARLLAQVGSEEERLRLLRRWSERPEAPAWFRIRLAYALRAAGLREEALTTMIEAAEASGRGTGR